MDYQIDYVQQSTTLFKSDFVGAITAFEPSAVVTVPEGGVQPAAPLGRRKMLQTGQLGVYVQALVGISASSMVNPADGSAYTCSFSGLGTGTVVDPARSPRTPRQTRVRASKHPLYNPCRMRARAPICCHTWPRTPTSSSPTPHTPGSTANSCKRRTSRYSTAPRVLPFCTRLRPLQPRWPVRCAVHARPVRAPLVLPLRFA